VVSSESGDATALTSLGDIDGLTATITISTGSSLYIFGHCGYYISTATSTNWGGSGRLYIATGADSPVVNTEHGNATMQPSHDEITAHLSLSTVITGLAAGEHTYKLRGDNTGSVAQTSNWHRSGYGGGIFIFEIGA